MGDFLGVNTLRLALSWASSWAYIRSISTRLIGRTKSCTARVIENYAKNVVQNAAHIDVLQSYR